MKYHLTYKLVAHPDGLSKDDVLKDPSQGACTAVVLMSLLYPDDGSYSSMVVSLDGRTGRQLPDAEVWKAWLMLAHGLEQSKTLSENKRALCGAAFEAVRRAMAIAEDPV